MFKKFTTLILFSFLFLSQYTQTSAIVDPLSVENNRFGIHIFDESDLEDARKLVNSVGGDWGYVTIVIREDERDVARWQKIFDGMRRQHLIPIVRIATLQLNSHWKKPVIDEIPSWISFLNSLNWVVKNRYVIVGNEPNHATEWGGQINPEEYADYLANFSEKAKYESEDFFVISAGMDASAPDNGEHMTEETFLKRMLNHKKDIFNYTDGWASHSYPNPNFSGGSQDAGRGTVRTYQWEKEILKSLGVEKNLPVFITETGWAHDENNKRNGYQSPYEIGRMYVEAYENAWNRDDVVSVTPFILNYQNPPFNMFSWKNKNGEFYDFYYSVVKIKKIKGKPAQDSTARVIFQIFPDIIEKNGNKYFLGNIKNTGQKIWDNRVVDDVEIEGKWAELETMSIFVNVEPGDATLALYRFK